MLELRNIDTNMHSYALYHLFMDILPPKICNTRVGRREWERASILYAIFP